MYLNKRDPGKALHYADALAHYTREEPLAWSDFYIARGRLLAQTLGRDANEEERMQAQQLLATAHDT